MAGNARNPFCDASKTKPLSREETTILRRLLQGEELHIGRHYLEELKTYGNSYFWDYNDQQWDGPVMMLLRRGLIYPTGVAGGAQWFVADRSKRVVHRMAREQRRRHEYGGGQI